MKVLDCMTICPQRPAQAALAWAIGALRGLAGRQPRRDGEPRRRHPARFAAMPGWRIDSLGAYFAYVRHPFPASPPGTVAERLAREHGVLLLPAPAFAGSPDHLRVSFANVDCAGIERLAERLAGVACPRSRREGPGARHAGLPRRHVPEPDAGGARRARVRLRPAGPPRIRRHHRPVTDWRAHLPWVGTRRDRAVRGRGTRRVAGPAARRRLPRRGRQRPRRPAGERPRLSASPCWPGWACRRRGARRSTARRGAATGSTATPAPTC